MVIRLRRRQFTVGRRTKVLGIGSESPMGRAAMHKLVGRLGARLHEDPVRSAQRWTSTAVLYYSDR